MKRAGVIGDPVDHSLSPVMHRAAMRATGLAATYDAWPTALDALATRVASLREPDVLGANVTVPHKQAVMSLVDDLTETARRIGAVNTVIPTSSGLLGDNTDAYGFRRSLQEHVDRDEIECAVVLGAGGAARAVIVALQEMDVDSIVVVNRTDERAADLARELGAGMAPWTEAPESEFPQVDLLVNATSLGWHDEMPVSDEALARLPEGATVVDLTYRDTAFLRTAAARKHPVLDGLGMLVHQGARAFELWTGLDAPVAVMREAVLEEQARRASIR